MIAGVRAWRRLLGLAIVLGAALFPLLAILRRSARHREPAAQPLRAAPRLEGLTSAEAAARKPDISLAQLRRSDRRHFMLKALRRSVLTTFNADLFGIAIVMYLLENPFGVLGAVVVILINVVLNVFQETYAKGQLDALAEQVSPRATVIRESRAASVHPEDVVEGDLVTVATGDAVIVDGVLVTEGTISVDEGASDGRADTTVRRRGDAVAAGSFCVDGHAVYRASEAWLERVAAEGPSPIELLPKEFTPLQTMTKRVLNALLVLVVLFGVLLVLDSYVLQEEIVSEKYWDAFSIVLGVAPTSLFFILIVHYSVGLVRISDRGALAYSYRDVEGLASVTTLCVSRASVLSGLNVRIEPLAPPGEGEPLSENRLRHMLGDLVHSAPVPTPAGHMLVEAVDGARRDAVDAAPFMRELGWHAATFADPDLAGTLVIGEPELITAAYEDAASTTLEEVGVAVRKARRGVVSWLRGLVGRVEDGDAPSGDEAAHGATPPAADPSELSSGDLAGGSSTGAGFRSWAVGRLTRLLSPMEELAAEEEPDDEAGPPTLVFAYSETPLPLYDARSRPRLPAGLVPLARIWVSETIHEGARRAVSELADTGIGVKLLTSGSAERAVATASALELDVNERGVVTGDQLEGVGPRRFLEKVRAASVLAGLTPTQKGAVVQALRSDGVFVAVLGSSVRDLAAMAAANTRMALKSSAQAVISAADVVLLRDYFRALRPVFSAGQRLVNGALDTFKLYLSQVVAQLLLIAAVALLALQEFPYHPTQGSVISAFTIAIPNMFLIVWAQDGILSGRKLRWRLAHFVVPAALTASVLALAVFWGFARASSDVAYAQLAVAYTLLGAGWFRILFLQPPTPFWTGGEKLRGDRRVIVLVFGMTALFAAVMAVPIFREWLKMDFLSPAYDYAIVAGAAIAWAAVLRTVWRTRALDWLARAVARWGVPPSRAPQPNSE